MNGGGLLGGWTVLVTGGGRRLGAVICRYLAAGGARVVVHYGVSGEAAEALCREVGGGAVAVGGDLSTGRGVDGVWAGALAAVGGKIDAVVNNAARFVGDGGGEAALAEMLAVNRAAPLRLAVLAEAQGARAVVQIGDGGVAGGGDGVWGGGFRRYAGSKRGMMADAAVLAGEWRARGGGCRMGVVLPGAVLRPVGGGVPGGGGVRGTPEGVAAEVVAFLAGC